MSKVISRFVFSLLFTHYSLHKLSLLDIVHNPLPNLASAVGVVFVDILGNVVGVERSLNGLANERANMLKLEYLEDLLTKLVAIRKVVMLSEHHIIYAPEHLI